jgi:hypothetical protein
MGRSRRLGAGAVAVLGAAVGSLMLSGPGEAAAGSAQLLISHAPASRVAQATTQNWGGYNQGKTEKGTLFRSVSATWTVPKATPHQRGRLEASSAWVGIGGGCYDVACNTGDGNTLIQTGTAQEVTPSGKSVYYSWYELIPAFETRIGLAVAPGQRVTGSVQELTTPNPLTGKSSWQITLRNLSTGKSFSKTVTYRSSHGTAEWIEETPTINGKFAPMPNLTRLVFTNVTANGKSAGLAAKEAITLARGGVTFAKPSAPSAGGGSFAACTYARSCARP